MEVQILSCAPKQNLPEGRFCFSFKKHPFYGIIQACQISNHFYGPSD